MQNLIKVPNDAIRHIWTPKCNCEEHQEVSVEPDYCETNGQPCCGECGEVFSLSHSLVDLNVLLTPKE